jgi:hypothetical protein
VAEPEHMTDEQTPDQTPEEAPGSGNRWESNRDESTSDATSSAVASEPAAEPVPAAAPVAERRWWRNRIRPVITGALAATATLAGLVGFAVGRTTADDDGNGDRQQQTNFVPAHGDRDGDRDGYGRGASWDDQRHGTATDSGSET